MTNSLLKRTMYSLLTKRSFERFFSSSNMPQFQNHLEINAMEVIHPQSDHKHRRPVILLNYNLDDIIINSWRHGKLKIATDGACNRLLEYFGPQKALESQNLPQFIIGDFDSARPDTLEKFSNAGSEIILAEDQNSSDVEKAVAFICQTQMINERPCEIIVAGRLGGRFDHSLGIINALYSSYRSFGALLFVVSSQNFVCLIPKHTIVHIECSLGTPCGILPIGAACQSVWTDGLRWNLEGQEIRFGGLVSTSNFVQKSRVTICSSEDLLWTMEVDPN